MSRDWIMHVTRVTRMGMKSNVHRIELHHLVEWNLLLGMGFDFVTLTACVLVANSFD